MKNRVRLAKMLLYFICGVGIVMSFLYLLTPRLLPFHVSYLGHAQGELDPRTVHLLLFAFRIIGGCFFAIHISVIIFISGKEKFETRTRWAVLVMLSIPYVITLLVALNIGGPWYLFSLGIVLAVSFFLLSVDNEPREIRP